MQTATPSEKSLIAKDLFSAEEKLQSFSTYFQLYDSLTSPQYVMVQIDPPALNTHADIRSLALKLREDPENTREEFQKKAFPQTSKNAETVKDQQRAINVAVQIMLMIDCSDKDRHHQGYEIGGFRPVSWNKLEKFTDFVKKVFPMDFHDPEKVRVALREKNELKCWNLKKRAHVKFIPTDNLAEHLLHDPQDNVVRLFRQTAFLKAHLQLSAGQPPDLGIADSLKLGTLPPQLLQETLHSLQYIIFPLVDKKSSEFLGKFIRDKESSFDPDCSNCDTNSIQPLEDFEYHYWGDRLAKLNHLVTHPRPSHRIGRWIQRNASERNAMFVAILSLVLSALFGFLSVILGIFQAWVAYMSWKAQVNAPQAP
ncbi:uncharacterized protein Bfra_011642 [Botrytis fragariae]|uniref:Uncharacterized protein n=1 Tax=Botrytis fragariae TaxID=1964551 RepID=A0A8H6EE87_9HELO|nr:uncharacterized protein Bfra_011642 [Botrytis fragariae]KAF5869099.1 hypothetical protein Bfra_011642 [Botrytis fragariae]